MKKLLGLLAMAPMAVAACGGSTEWTPGDINVYTRDSTSGTREGFMKTIGEADLVSGTVEVTGNGDMIAKVKADDQGIGYISLTTLSGSGLKGLDFNGIEATEDNVLETDTTKQYAMSRDFGYTTITEATKQGASDAVVSLVEEFNIFLGTVDGKVALRSAGVIVADADFSGDYTANSDVCDLASTNILIGGSTSVEKAATALSTALGNACSAFNGVHAHTGSSASEAVGADDTMHIGFSSSGTRTGWDTDNESGVLGKDAIVAVVNGNNTLDNITTEDLSNIYTGTTDQITKWSEVL